MAETPWVFLSSTQKDLKPYRAAVSHILDKNRYLVLKMEASAARDQEPLEACLDDVAVADAFVGIYAWRYGFVPPGSVTSITEQELLAAQRLGKPIFCFLVDESFEWPTAFKEVEGASQLEALKQRIKVKYDSDFFTTPDNLAASVLSALTQWRDRERGERERAAPPDSPESDLLLLLKKVKHLWIDDFLQPSVPPGWRLHIEREERPEDVGRSVVAEWQPEIAAGQAGEPLYDFLEGQDRKLLLLGEPGSGKTTALLELARGLAGIALKEPSSPVPVVFHLASWEQDCAKLDDWMEQELRKQYGASEANAKEWLKPNKPNKIKILPLLDGLDEVAPGARSSCVTAINAYLKDKGLRNPGMVVACHSQVYRELGRHLRLDTAVVLRPLTSSQVDWHLAGAGEAFSGLRAALGEDADLRELASTPLMLYLLKKTFKGAASTDIPRGLATDRAARLWKAFVKQMLEPPLPWLADDEEPRPPSKGQFSSQATRRSLTWLAQGMAGHKRALFQIERLQPSWLPAHDKPLGVLLRTLYSLIYHLAGGVLLTLPLALVNGRAAFVGAGLLAGLLVGALEIPRLLRQVPRSGGLRAILRRAISRTLYLSGLTALLLIPLSLLWRPADVSRNELLASAVLVVLLTGAVFGSHAAVRSGKRDIRVAEELHWRRWSRRGSLFGAGYALLASLSFWGLYLVSRSQTGYGPEFWIPFSVVVSLLGSALFGALGGLGRKGIGEKTNRPNQGTWRALANAGLVALLTALLVTSGLELMLASLDLAQKLFVEEALPRAFNTGNALALLKTGIVLGFWAGLAYSGLDFVQHFSLRLVLGLGKLAPFRLVPFLSYAVGRGLMQGSGSYKFFHPLLGEWFAKSSGSPGPGK